jgi:hypothetical protein
VPARQGFAIQEPDWHTSEPEQEKPAMRNEGHKREIRIMVDHQVSAEEKKRKEEIRDQ